MAYNSILEKAERFIHSSKVLANDGDYDSAASRLYYAMFYIAQALLDARGWLFSSHKGVISAFGQHLVKTQELESRFHQALTAAYGQQQLGDYAIDSGLQLEDIETKSINAKDFLATARKMLV
jgi:uncharacterized protein (UPF0332 family)